MLIFQRESRNKALGWESGRVNVPVFRKLMVELHRLASIYLLPIFRCFHKLLLKDGIKKLLSDDQEGIFYDLFQSIRSWAALKSRNGSASSLYSFAITLVIRLRWLRSCAVRVESICVPERIASAWHG